MVPTMIAMVLNHPDFRPERLASLTDLVYGASPMPAALLQRLFELLPDIDLWQGYGMTECSSVLTFLTADDHRRRRRACSARPVGRRWASTSACARRTARWPRPARTARSALGAATSCASTGAGPSRPPTAFRDGWYHTGDEGHLDAEGYLYLVDRVKDMIVSGGENVYSIEVENAISTHPAVDQVAVIGIPHPVLGEQVHAIVVLRPGAEATEDDIKDHARTTIAGYKVPKSVEFRTEPIPLSGALKPLKRELRKPYWSGHGALVG